MNRSTFELLRCLAEANATLSAGDASRILGMPCDVIIAEQAEKGFVDANGEITGLGLAALAPYKVRRAIVLAAGMSTRFAPFSYEKPKGLTVVKGEVLIERQIRQLKEAGVEEIVLVLGHMMEKFLYLSEKYGAKIVINKEYRYKNTHSSIYFAREYLENSHICCADTYWNA